MALSAMAGDALAFFGRKARHEVAGEFGDIVDALAQRRHPDREHVQAVVEIFAELAVFDLLDHVAVGRRDQAEVDLDRLLRTDRIDLAFLQRAQQLDLRFERQFADFVEEQRAAVGFLEFADASVDGARERALLVAEQDAFDQVFRDRAAVDGDERLAGALAFALDGACDQFLADAALAFDENGDVRCGRALAERDDALHGVAAHDRDR